MSKDPYRTGFPASRHVKLTSMAHGFSELCYENCKRNLIIISERAGLLDLSHRAGYSIGVPELLPSSRTADGKNSKKESDRDASIHGEACECKTMACCSYLRLFCDSKSDFFIAKVAEAVKIDSFHWA